MSRCGVFLSLLLGIVVLCVVLLYGAVCSGFVYYTVGCVHTAGCCVHNMCTQTPPQLITTGNPLQSAWPVAAPGSGNIPPRTRMVWGV